MGNQTVKVLVALEWERLEFEDPAGTEYMGLLFNLATPQFELASGQARKCGSATASMCEVWMSQEALRMSTVWEHRGLELRYRIRGICRQKLSPYQKDQGNPDSRSDAAFRK